MVDKSKGISMSRNMPLGRTGVSAFGHPHFDAFGLFRGVSDSAMSNTG